MQRSFDVVDKFAPRKKTLLYHFYTSDMSHTAKILVIEPCTHDVLRIVLEKPEGLTYKPGQAVDIAVNQEDWKDKLRTFTFTSLPTDPTLEFAIKTYPEHNGVTHHLRTLKAGDEILLHDVYGDIAYKGEGVFIAGGAGITPFIAIFKWLQQNNQVGGNKLIFANRTKADIIKERYFTDLLVGNFINVLSHEQHDGYLHGFVNADIIQEQMAGGLQYVYLCGPPPMMTAVEKILQELGISQDNIVKEGF